MRGKRTGQLTNEETWRAVKEEGIKPAAVAAFEGVSTAAIYMRISHEKRRRAALTPTEADAQQRERDTARVAAQPARLAGEGPVGSFMDALEALTASLALL